MTTTETLQPFRLYKNNNWNEPIEYVSNSQIHNLLKDGNIHSTVNLVTPKKYGEDNLIISFQFTGLSWMVYYGTIKNVYHLPHAYDSFHSVKEIIGNVFKDLNKN